MADATLLRESLPAFADAIGQPLTTWQSDPLKLEKRTTVIVAPRQAGKSRSLAVLALHRAFSRERQVVLVISAGDEAAKRLLGEVRRMATRSRLLARSIVEEQSGLLKLSNGSEIRSVPASERQIRGWTVDLLLIDEAAVVGNELILSAAFPTTAAKKDARIVMASSASAASGTFYDHYRRGEVGDEHVTSVLWRLKDCTWISPSWVAGMQASMSETAFRAEMEGVFATGNDSMFSRAVLDAATAPYDMHTLASLRGPARLLGGVDWGAVYDRSVCVAIGRVPLPAGADGPVFAVAMSQRWDQGYPLTDVVDELVRSPAHWAMLTPEVNGIGIGPTQMLVRDLRRRKAEDGGGRRGGYMILDESPDRPRKPPSAWDRKEAKERFVTRVNPIHNSAASKAAAYIKLRMLLDGGQLVLPESAVELRRELLLLTVDLSPGGTERIEAGTGHDDCADALALALGPQKPKGAPGWTTTLGRVADPRRPAIPPDLPPNIELETVTTPSGIEVPRAAVFQSVAGRHVTVPADLAPRQRGPRRVGHPFNPTPPRSAV